jgi:tRNA U34 5-methylaminomethyl-2-thiouridine-forming methyltransferase MnmC
MFKLILTEDGSTSIENTLLNETYHSVHGAIQESSHVFIQCGLQPLIKENITLRIFEMGFGTGLNAFLTLKAIPSSVKVEYITVEKFPLREEHMQALNFGELIGNYTEWEKIWHAPFGKIVQVTDNFSLGKFHSDFLEFNAEGSFDLLYYDAFGPKTQPELWSLEAMQKCSALVKGQGVLVTYCAQGQFRRNLKASGFLVEKLAGPPGKREITRGIKKIVE